MGGAYAFGIPRGFESSLTAAGRCTNHDKDDATYRYVHVLALASQELHM